MNMLRRVGVLLVVVIGSALVPGVVGQASAANFTPGPGTYTVDTSALNLTGPGTSVTGVDEGGVAVFGFGNVSIPSGATINVQGSRPFELKAAGELTLAGLINGSGTSATTEVPGPNAGGPGGGAGATDGSQAGSGAGGGGPGSTKTDGGGGGGFGGVGARGGHEAGIGGAAGAAYGDLNAALKGGSGGAGGTIESSNVGGGGGGGGVELSASSLTISASGEVRVNGGNGNGGGFGASGGGSGGGIILHGGTINVTGALNANGGEGGTGGCCGDGGGGGGGRIAYQYRTLTSAGTANVAGGTSGTSGTFGSFHPSPDATGAVGVVTKAEAATATTTAATSVSTSGATLNGTANPNGNPTTYHFEYGTSTAYGTSVPMPDAAVGSDSTNHHLALAVSGLASGTTYHYRIVATDQIGFTSAGADMTVTTSSKPPSPQPPPPPSPPPSPPPAFAGASIQGGTVAVKNGIAYLTVSSKLAGTGELTLTDVIDPTTGKVISAKKRHRKTITLGTASFSIAAGQTKTIKVHLSAYALKLLNKDKTMKATATAVTTDTFGTKVTTKSKVTLKRAKTTHRKKH
jgi:hypothetical protein